MNPEPEARWLLREPQTLNPKPLDPSSTHTGDAGARVEGRLSAQSRGR